MGFDSCVTRAVNMKSKEMSMQVKEAITRLKKQNASVKEIAKSLGEGKLRMFYLVKNKEHSDELNNIRRSGRLRVSLSNSTIKRYLHERTYRGLITRHKPLAMFKKEMFRKARLDFDRNHPKRASQVLESDSLTEETKINSYQI